MKTMYRILGERGRVTIPYEMRKAVGFANEDLPHRFYWCDKG